MIWTRLHVRVADAAQRLVDGLDADAVVADLARLHEVVEDAEHLRHVVDLRVRAVELQQVDRIHLEVAQAALDPRAQVRAAVALRSLYR